VLCLLSYAVVLECLICKVIKPLTEASEPWTTLSFIFRYETYICSNEEEEMVGDGPVDQLLEHLPSKMDQLAQGSCDNFKLELPDAHDNRAWFTKATLIRF